VGEFRAERDRPVYLPFSIYPSQIVGRSKLDAPKKERDLAFVSTYPLYFSPGIVVLFPQIIHSIFSDAFTYLSSEEVSAFIQISK
jgi:hypothetical protein